MKKNLHISNFEKFNEDTGFIRNVRDVLNTEIAEYSKRINKYITDIIRDYKSGKNIEDVCSMEFNEYFSQLSYDLKGKYGGPSSILNVHFMLNHKVGGISTIELEFERKPRQTFLALIDYKKSIKDRLIINENGIEYFDGSLTQIPIYSDVAKDVIDFFKKEYEKKFPNLVGEKRYNEHTLMKDGKFKNDAKEKSYKNREYQESLHKSRLEILKDYKENIKPYIQDLDDNFSYLVETRKAKIRYYMLFRYDDTIVSTWLDSFYYIEDMNRSRYFKNSLYINNLQEIVYRNNSNISKYDLIKKNNIYILASLENDYLNYNNFFTNASEEEEEEESYETKSNNLKREKKEIEDTKIFNRDSESNYMYVDVPNNFYDGMKLIININNNYDFCNLFDTGVHIDVNLDDEE